MKIVQDFDDELVALLCSGGIAVIRTDTIYGIVARADNEAAVERIYTVKQRSPHKSAIVLLAKKDGIFDTPSAYELGFTKGLWPGKNSIIFPSAKAPSWLDRGNESIAYRIPDDDRLCELLKKTGPLIAPSANPEGLPPAMNIKEAIDYFGELVDIYVDGGQVTDNTPSKLFKITGEGLERLR
jgi:L-threonylcarbamoyladenylate synthase